MARIIHPLGKRAGVTMVALGSDARGCRRLVVRTAHPTNFGGTASPKTERETMENRRDAEANAPDNSEIEPELVDVFETQQESEAMVIRGLLESAGIEALVSGFDAPQDVLPGVGGVRVLVSPDEADEARRLISDHQGQGPEPGEELDATDVDELDANEGSAA